MALVCLCRGNFYWPPHTTILFCSIFLDKIVLDTLKSRYHRSAPLGIGFITGKVFGGTKVGGITRERNSFLSVWKGGLTRLRNGTGHIYGKVMLKGLVNIAAMRSMSGPISGAFSSAWDWIMWLFGDQTGIGYI